MTVQAEMTEKTTSVDDDHAISLLARVMYLHYCTAKGFDPYPAPWAPRWCIDYAAIAVRSYGYDGNGVNELKQTLAGLAE